MSARVRDERTCVRARGARARNTHCLDDLRATDSTSDWKTRKFLALMSMPISSSPLMYWSADTSLPFTEKTDAPAAVMARLKTSSEPASRMSCGAGCAVRTARASGRARRARARETHDLARGDDVHEADGRSLGRALSRVGRGAGRVSGGRSFACVRARGARRAAARSARAPRPHLRLALDAEDEVRELLGADARRLHAEHEGDGVHHVRLARAIRPDDARKVFKGPDRLRARVGFEIHHLEAVDAAHRALL